MSRRVNADPDSNLSMDFDLAREVRPLSRHLAERHPQVLIIALATHVRAAAAFDFESDRGCDSARDVGVGDPASA